MKIVILGFSGSGKSTLAKKLAKHYHLDILYLDSIFFKPNWVIRDREEFDYLIKKFMNEHDSWIIEGNYMKSVPERFLEADQIFYLSYNRFFCLRSVLKRYKKNKNKTRESMAEGCKEKLDLSFLWQVFYKGRKRKKRKRLLEITKNSKEGLVFKNRKALHQYLKELGVENYETSM
ncbi:MAG: hypothetical protein K2I42_00480 [Anaeroplasmataceae bacterium]|nr:hypothetical protein [Anaeroplasmataceae bacterium]